MNALKNLLAIKPDSHKLFFLLLRCSYCFSGFLLLLILKDGFQFFMAGLILSGLAILGFQFGLSVLAEKLIEKKSYAGFILIIGLNLVLLLSIFFPLALYGMYIFFSKEFRQNNLEEEKPLWLSMIFDYYDQFQQRLPCR